MKKIGLMGTTDGAEAIEYYNHISDVISKDIPDFDQNNICIYSIKLHKDDEEGSNVMKLVDAVFYMMTLNIDSLIVCNHKLELLIKNNIDTENFPVPTILESGISVANNIIKMGRTKLIIFTNSITAELHYFLTSLKNKEIELLPLHESNRKQLEEFSSDFAYSKSLSASIQNTLNYWFKKLPEYGINGILVDSPLLHSLLQQLHVNIPIFYTRKIHAEQAALFMLT